MLTQAQQLDGERRLIGLSALPGCGKSSFGAWLEAASSILGQSVQVVSIDDFYFTADDLDQAMNGNPWKVPRALPGSHDIPLLTSRLKAWKRGDQVELPCFDKALRQGRGDRSGWRPCNAQMLVLEGWFVGCLPTDELPHAEDHLDPPLRADERAYRQRVQATLQDYRPIWSQLDQLWHLRASDLSSPTLWKRQQEASMQQGRGVSLGSAAIEDFIRMILSAIPSPSLQKIAADVVVEVDRDRQLTRIHLNPSN